MRGAKAPRFYFFRLEVFLIMARKNTEDNILKEIENELDKVFKKRALSKKNKDIVKKGIKAARELANLGFLSKNYKFQENDNNFNKIQNCVKALWEANYTLVRAFNEGRGVDIRFYMGAGGTYYNFEYLDKVFINKVLKLSEDGLIFNKEVVKTKDFSEYKQRPETVTDKISNILYKHTTIIRKIALGISKSGGRKVKCPGEIDDSSNYTVKAATENEYFCVENYKNWKKTKKSSDGNNNYAYRSEIQYSENGTDYIYYRYKTIDEKNNKIAKYSYYKGDNDNDPIFFNYGWLREHSLQVAVNTSNNNNTQVTNDMIRQVFGMAPDNTPGYRTGDVNLTQVKNVNNIHLMSLNTIKELAIMFLNLDSETLKILYSDKEEDCKSTEGWSELRNKIKKAYGDCSDEGLEDILGKFEKTLT
jgi:hypothetical protein